MWQHHKFKDHSAPLVDPGGSDLCGQRTGKKMPGDEKNAASDEAGTADVKDDTQAPQAAAEEDAPKEDKAETAGTADVKDGTQAPQADEEDRDAPKKKAKAASPAPAKGSRCSTRERKSTMTYAPPPPVAKTTEIAEGSGEALSEHPNVVEKFKNVTYNSEALHDLHHIVFGGRVKKTLLKGNLMAFRGLVYPDGKEDEAKEKVLGRMYKLKLGPLKEAIGLADFSTSGLKGKEEICDGFLAWLENPQPSGKELAAKRKAKRKSTSKKAPSKSKEEKKPVKKKAKKSASKAQDETAKMIPGVPEEKLRTKIKSIIGNSDVESVTVKDIRKELEDWLDMKLDDYKGTIRSITLDELSS